MSGSAGCRSGAGARGRSPGRRSRVRALARLAGYVLSAALLAWLVWLVARDWRVVSSQRWRLKPAWVALACAMLLGARFLLPVAVALVLRAFGRRVPLRTCWWVYSLSQFAKYAPGGGLWLVLARSYLYKRHGIAGATGVVLMLAEQGALVAAAFAVFGFSLRWFPAFLPTLWLWVFPATVATLALFLHPRFLAWLHRVVARKLEGRASDVRVSPLPLGGSFAVFVVFWAVSGVAFWALTAGLVGARLGFLVPAAGGFAGSCGFGFLVFVAPAGLGAREGGLAGLLSLFYPLPVAAAVALAARFWWFVVDLVFCGGSLLVARAVGVVPRREELAAASGGAPSPSS